MRPRIARAVEALIALLDEIESDADLEAEPNLEDGHDAERDEAEHGLCDGDALSEFYSDARGLQGFERFACVGSVE